MDIFFIQNNLLAFWGVFNLSHNPELDPSSVNLLLQLVFTSYLKSHCFLRLKSLRLLLFNFLLAYLINHLDSLLLG